MPEPKVDLRVQKTERALMDAMEALIKERPVNEITVSDLCDVAMVRRATFYKHFKDKYEFLDFCIERRLRPFDTGAGGEDACDPVEGCMVVTREMLHFMHENRALMEKATKRTEVSGLADVFARQLTRVLREMAEEGEKQLVAPPEIVATFYAGALLGVTRWWATERPEMTEAELLSHIETMLRACLPLVVIEKENKHERKSAKEQ